MKTATPLQHLLGSVSFKVAVFAISLVVVIFIITGSIATRYSYKTAAETALRESTAAMRFATKALNEELEWVEQTAHFISDRPELITNDPMSAYKPLQELLFAYPDIATVGIMFRENYYPSMGREYAPIAKWNETKDTILTCNSIDMGFAYLDAPQDTNWMESSQGFESWSEPFISPTSGVMRIAYSVPLYHGEDLFAVLCLSIDMDWLQDLLNDCNPHNDGVTAAVSQYGTVLCSYDSTTVMRDNIMDLAQASGDTAYIRLANEVMQGHNGVVHIHDPESSIIYFHHVPSTDWTFFFVYPDTLLSEQTAHFYWRMACIFCVAIVVLFFLLTWGIFRIIKPFSHKLQNISEDKARIERDLKIASALQQHMLPKPSAIGTLTNTIDIAGTLIPARSIGGDIYDYFRRGDKLVFCIGDVSGKGIPASLFMVVVRTLLHEITRWELQPDKIMTRLNHGLLRTNSENMFCTMFLCVMDTTSGHTAYCNAGHTPPVLYRHNQDGGETNFMHTHIDLPLGIEESTIYHTDELSLNKGDALFLYTDGVTEAENTSAQQFGESSTLQLLQAHYDTSREVVDTILQAVRTFSASTEQSDDITMLCVKLIMP